jgi:hypothetical protein
VLVTTHSQNHFVSAIAVAVVKILLPFYLIVILFIYTCNR